MIIINLKGFGECKLGSISVGDIVVVVVVEEDAVCERGETVEEAPNKHFHGGVVREGEEKQQTLKYWGLYL